MRPERRMLLGLGLLAPGLVFWNPSYGDEPGRFGRLFRLGQGQNPSPTAPAEPGRASTLGRPDPSTSSRPLSNFGSDPDAVPITPTPPQSRLAPQPRTSRAATESDPLATRVVLGRSDSGSQFAMFLQVFADGTVIDGEGVHKVSQDALKPLVDSIQAGEILKVKGHCGGPSTDFVEQVHMVVYERSLGRLRANAFSFSGNPQGCDHAVKHVQLALDAIQAKVTGTAPPAATANSTPIGASVPTAAPLGLTRYSGPGTP